MTRVLLTGGSGFIAAHVLEYLLKDGHSVVTTVRSQAKANKIKEAYPKVDKSQLDFAIVEDIAQPNAFDEAIKSDPPFEAVIHTASPFHFNAQDIKKDLLDPAINGTVGILKAIHKSAPTVKRVVITSSFAAIVHPFKGLWPEHTYSEKDWSPLTLEQALENQSSGYRASKTFAEKAAWEFLEKEKPNFTVATINPPLVFGPVVHYLNSLDSLNTSNTSVRDMLRGKTKEELPNSTVPIFVDVRDVALSHVRAMEREEAANKRFFCVAGYFSPRDVAGIIRKNFAEYADVVPESAKGGELPKEVYKIDNSRSKEILGIQYRGLEESIVDLVKSLKKIGA